MPRAKRAATAPKQQFHQSLAAAELAYTKSRYGVEAIVAKEDKRRLETRILVQHHDLETLNVQAEEQGERIASVEAERDGFQVQHRDVQKLVERLETELKARIRECDALRTQMQESQSDRDDTAKLTAEKLALTREISSMKPELEHLRSQALSNADLLSEKLALAREVKDARVELEDSAHHVQRLEKQQEKHEKRERASAQQNEELKREVEEAREAIVGFERERSQALAREVAAAEADNSKEVDSLRNELTKARRDRQKLEKEHAREAQGWEAEKAVLDDKLSQFRSKLRATKEKLRDTEAELESARATAREALLKKDPVKSGKNPRKRSSAQSVDPDATIGTPGDGEANKRAKRASSVVGEKSTFSITPFLNRTTSVPPEGPDEPMASIEDQSPSTRSTMKTTTKTIKVLTDAGAGKSNPKIRAKRSIVSEPTLEMVTEEIESQDENTAPAVMAPAAKEVDEKTTNKLQKKPKLKPRKSLATFSTFREGSLQPESRMGSIPPVQKKKRKLIGSAGAKTLFDEDEEEDTAAGAGGGKSLFGGSGQRAFGTFGRNATQLGRGLLSKQRGPLQTADGFAFSPLKKERRAMAAASRAGSEVPDA